MNAAASSFTVPSPAPLSTPGPLPAPELGFIPEFQLLIDCCAEISDGERTQRIQRIFSGRFNWEELLRLAQHHRLIPHVYKELSRLDLAAHELLDKLRTRNLTNARQALWLTSELIRIVNHFEALGIAVLPYKGPALAEGLYADVTMRQFGDLDLLVHAADVRKATAALLDLGYKVSLQLTRRQERAYLESGYEYTFNSAHGRNLVELKWKVLPHFYSVGFDVDAMFEKAVEVSVGGHTVRTLCAEDLLLVLCVHAAKHAWTQVPWLRDITQLAKQPLDWGAIERQSKGMGVERIVGVSFFLAHKLLGTPLPEMVEKCALRDRAIGVLTEEIAPTIAQSMEYDTESIRYFRLMMKVRERWQDRVRFLWRLAFTPTAGDWAAVPLPASLFPLYRLVRMFRLSGKLLGRRD